MPKATRPGPALWQGLVPLVAGLAVGGYGVAQVGGQLSAAADTALPIGALAALCVGGLSFAVGFMLTVIALARPLFGKRPQDEGTGA